ncbi:hypothetical protein RHMOL_Rhmol10G0163100 [Rhododendron molle]|uniref:Uncharacterized protein n=1 Tax=Rhododendron molle TaxID=49168 RepID=A0ACC0M4G7_RHOML|nr:hypothetical protein RHMOL_Rhmol10G0163100 [Rhododendron molle]
MGIGLETVGPVEYEREAVRDGTPDEHGVVCGVYSWPSDLHLLLRRESLFCLHIAQPVLDQWLNSFNSLDRLHFKSFGMDFLFSLRQIPVNFSFLRAATSLWDPAFHVFRFRREELCPTIKEFVAIIGHSDREGIIVPNPLFNQGNLLKDLLQVQKHEVRFFMVNGRLETLQLVQRFGTAEAHRQVPQQKVWLYEKLRVWDMPERLPYSSDHCMERRVTRQFPTKAAWKAWMKTRKGDRIQWVCPWYGVKSMTTSTMNYFGVAVIGITQVTLYFPARFQRQFGAELVKVLGDPEYAVSKVHNANLCRNVLRLWPNRIMQEVAENFADKLSGSYKRWLEKNLLKDKSVKRRKTKRLTLCLCLFFCFL